MTRAPASAARRGAHRHAIAAARPIAFEALERRLLLAFSPTPQEQFMLELLNRMRASPAAELGIMVDSLNPIHSPDSDVNDALQFFDVNGTTLAQQWSTLAAAPPLAWNESLYNAARGHSQLMITQDSQSHQLPGEPSLGNRLTNAGYTNFSVAGENIFAFAESVFHGHTGFAIDWGNSPTGIQSPPGHRLNMMDPAFREIGIGILTDSSPATDVGPLVITQDFGNRFNLGNSYVLGVVYSDNDSDDFYSVGEGLGGVSIQIVGTGGTFNTTTMTAGGYQLQVPAGTYNITASGGSLASPIIQQNVAVGSANVKRDFKNGSGTPPPPPPTAPEIAVLGNSVNIADGDSSPSATDGTDFGSVARGGAAITRTFTVMNTGNATLNLGSLSLPAGFSAGNNALVSSLAAGASDTFNVTLATGASGTFSGSISFTNNDSDENPFNFAITGRVTAVNSAPVGSNGSAVTLEDSTYTLAASDFGFSDPGDSPPHQLSAVKITTVPNASKGLLKNNGITVTTGQFVSAADISAGKLTFVPVTHANGSPFSSFTFQVQDSGGTASGGVNLDPTPNTLTLNVTAVNDAPSFTKGADQAINTTSAQTVAGWATAIIAGPSNEFTQTLSFLVSTTNPGLFAVAPAVAGNGTLTYTPAPSASGTATVTVRVKDNAGTANGGVDTSAPQTFIISVNAINDAPSFTATDPPTVSEDAGLQTLLNWATFDPGSPDESSQAATYLISNVSNAALFTQQPSVSAAGTLTYTPAANASGSSTFTVRVKDSGGTANGGVDTSPTQAFTITVNSVNDTPSFTASNPPATHQDATPQQVANWATFSAGAANEAGQTATYLVSNITNAALFSSAPSVDGSGTLRYTPAPGVTGSSTFDVAVKDSGGTANAAVDTSTPQIFTITVHAVNHAPTFTKGPDPSVAEDAGVQVVAGWASGIAPGPAEESSQSLTFFVTSNNNALFTTRPTIDTDGALTFTPAPNATGSATVSVRLIDNGGTANGGSDTSALQTFTITVTPVNDAPSFTAVDPPATFEDAGPRVVANWASFTAGPADEASQTASYLVTAVSNPDLFAVAPTVEADGTLHYTAADNVSDSGGTANGGVDTAALPKTFTITVQPTNDAPQGADHTLTVVAGGAIDISAGVLGFSDPNDSPTHQLAGVKITTLPDKGQLALNGTPVAAGQVVTLADLSAGLLVFTAPATGHGLALTSFTFQVRDTGDTANGGADLDPTPRTITLDVTDVATQASFEEGTDGFTLAGEAQVVDDGQGNHVVQLGESGSDAISQSLDLPANVGDISFDFRFTGAGQGDRLVLLLDDGVHEIELFTATADAGPGGSGLVSTGPISLATFAGQAVTLSIRLEGAGAPDAQVHLDNLAIHTGDFTTLLFGGKVKATYIDADGDTVVVGLSGPGSGTVMIPTGGGDAIAIVVRDTTVKSSLVITTKGTTSVQDVMIDGDVKDVKAGRVSLGRNFISGALKKAQFLEVRGDHLISIGASANPKDAVTLVLGRVQDLTINSLIPIKSISAVEWLDSDPEVSPDLITAPWLGKLAIKGDKKAAIAGNFQAGLSLSGSGLAKLTLGSAKIAGAVSHGPWTIAGSTGAITAASIASDWSAQISGAIKSITTAGDASGSVTADTLGSFTVKGSLLAATLTLTHAVDAKVPALGSLKVTGATRNLQLRSTGNIKSITLVDLAEGSNLFAGVDDAVAGMFEGGSSLPAVDDLDPLATIFTLSIKGRLESSAIAAGRLNKVTLKEVAPDHDDIAFGLRALALGSYKRSLPLPAVSASNPPAGVVDQLDDYSFVI